MSFSKPTQVGTEAPLDTEYKHVSSTDVLFVSKFSAGSLVRNTGILGIHARAGEVDR